MIASARRRGVMRVCQSGRPAQALRCLLIAALAALAPGHAGAQMPGCQITVHAALPDGGVQVPPLLDAQRVLEVRESEVDPTVGTRRFLVSLDDAGSRALAAHTAAHIGQLIAVACDGEIVSRALIREVISSPLAVLVEEPLGDPPGADDLDAPRDILAWVELPRSVARDEQVTLTLTLLNARTQGNFLVSAVDIGVGFLDGFEVIAVTPEPHAREYALGALALTLSVDLAPGAEWTLEVRLQPRSVGVFVGDIDIWAGDRFLTRVAQLQVR